VSRRDEILREMGLWPVWRLRGVAEAVSVAPPPGPLEPAETGAARTQHRSACAATIDRRTEILSMDWRQLKTSVASCSACRLHEQRTQIVFGVGDERADWLFIGEGPGADEDRIGEPFVGQAGKLLDNMLAAIKLKRGDNVYIANAVKCRPPGNRNPAPDEISDCEPYLVRQIELIQPRLIVVLGRIAAQALLGTQGSIASLRGRVLEYRGIPLIVTYHPAYLLRNLTDKAKGWADLCFARSTMERLASR
jgi:uracil-DNA glycosylase family 4